MRQLHVISDLQFGSCGKGLFAGYLARQIEPDTIVTAWAPNAGHTFIEADGTRHVNIALPNGIITPGVKRVLLGPGSVINPTILYEEMTRYHRLLNTMPRIWIHEHAAVVDQRHRDAEGIYGAHIGSTMKGVGEAMCEKIRRQPGQRIVAKDAFRGTAMEELVVSVRDYNEFLDLGQTVLVEGAQGFSLGINQGFYPYCTSRDCTVNQMMSDCAIPLNWADDTEFTSYGVCRTFPIRVNNRGHSSGPGYGDQEELSWAQVGVPPELTTVTKLQRRVFSFSEEQIRQAIRMNGIDCVFLNFCNYLQGDLAKLNVLNNIIDTIQRYAPVRWLGFGPKVTDIEKGPNRGPK